MLKYFVVARLQRCPFSLKYIEISSNSTKYDKQVTVVTSQRQKPTGDIGNIFLHQFYNVNYQIKQILLYK